MFICVEHMERSSLDVEIHTLIMEDQQVMANFSYDGMDIHDLEAMLVYMDYPGHKGIWREGLMQWEIIVKLVFYILIFLVAIICNSLVLIVLVKKRSLRNVMHMFIINLAVADILVTLFAIWIDIVDDFAERWILGPFLCKFQPFIQCKYIFGLVNLGTFDAACSIGFKKGKDKSCILEQIL